MKDGGPQDLRVSQIFILYIKAVWQLQLYIYLYNIYKIFIRVAKKLNLYIIEIQFVKRTLCLPTKRWHTEHFVNTVAINGCKSSLAFSGNSRNVLKRALKIDFPI